MRQPISSDELRELFQQFFESKGHARIPSAPLVPENDPTVLFTTAGMHPLVPYLKGQPHPGGTRLVDVQKCLRTTDIDEVGDATHATVFEMLGNWSLGDYFKEEAITMSWEFLTSPEWLGIDPQQLAVSVFAGDADAPVDEEAVALWRKMGVPEERIARLGKEDNWWPAGGGSVGPQGPDTEMFYWTGEGEAPVMFDPEDGRWVEIWNDVFMQFNGTEDGALEPLAQQNVDTGMGLERTVMILNGFTSIYEIDTYTPLMNFLRTLVGVEGHAEKQVRILADHLKAAVFILGDENRVRPSNTEQGYVLRRLIRRAIRVARTQNVADTERYFTEGARLVIAQYEKAYPLLRAHEDFIVDQLLVEHGRFQKALVKGEKVFRELAEQAGNETVISGTDAFHLYETYGFPLELTQEMAQEQGKTVEVEAFEKALATHQEASRSARQGKFAGGLADHSEASVRYHTATHLLHQALRDVLGEHVLQKGSNITPERLRFDFSHPEKLTPEQIVAVEELVNAKIAEGLAVERAEMSVAEAKKAGALGLFEHKYGERVSVYTVGDYSTEICGGPHVETTAELGKFKITKEESAGGGVRRIKAKLDS